MTDLSKEKSAVKAVLNIVNNSETFGKGMAVMFSALEIYLQSVLGAVYVNKGEEACRKGCTDVSDSLIESYDQLSYSCLFSSIEDLMHRIEEDRKGDA